ncbi:MAG: Wzz/FepE/Etk N-terminal domain-containing protein [Clostridiales bacterium]|nr:Wzz/FepE/Etk N-terminal domain-containing protein [Eubacteriales bacterium]MDH7566517.1 Wzz/FepE/Etk N-terminal domain-containing protein [Clostridiales bacterium]
MELKQYFSIIYKRIWMVIALPLMAALASGYVSLCVLDKVYEADTTLYVINKKADSQSPIAYNDIMTGQYLVKDYRELVKSRTVTSTVIQELGIKDLTLEDLASNISVNSKNDTRIIEIKVQDKDPQRAAQLADKVGEVFINKVVDLMKVENVSIVDRAQTSSEPVKPRPGVNIAVAFFAGLMAAVGIAFLMEYLDDTIKTSEDIEKYLDLTVLGTIPVFNIK